MNLTPRLKAVATLALAAVVLSACRHDDDVVVINPAPKISARDYVPAYPGSYWVYESYYVDSNGNGRPGNVFGNQSVIDSCYQAADTVFGGNTYQCLMKPSDIGSTTYEPTYYRDSSGYLVTPQGQILFAPLDTNRVYGKRTIDDASFISGDSAILVSHYTGAARTVVAENRNIPTLAAVTEWTFVPFARDDKPAYRRRMYTRYAPGIGIVYETSPVYTSDPGYAERRLIRSRVIYPVE